MMSKGSVAGIASDSTTIPSLLAIDSIAPNLFRNQYNQSNAYSMLFGGQIASQALAAADATVPKQSAHSLHGYFLRPGSTEQLIDLQVEQIRDGRRFCNRRVTASQAGTDIFVMDCSYRAKLDGFEHQRPAEFTFDPENAIDFGDLAQSGRTDLLPFIQQFATSLPLEVRIPEEPGFLQTGPSPKRHYWLRAKGCEAIDSPILNRQILVYLSDFLLSGVPLVPHTVALPGPHLFVASLDHCVWFHREARCDDWLLFETSSPNAHGAVNLSQALVYDRSGQLIASITQESMQIPLTEDR